MLKIGHLTIEETTQMKVSGVRKALELNSEPRTQNPEP